MKHLNNASSQTKNYEITFSFHFRVTEGSYHSSLFLLFLKSKKASITIIYPWNVLIYFLMVILVRKRILECSGLN